MLVVTVDLQDWCLPLINRLSYGALPDDDIEARHLSHKAKSFVIIDGMLYKKSALGINHKCITFEEGRLLLAEVHRGTCGHHAALRSLAGKAFRQGFYWPTVMPTLSRLSVPVRAFNNMQANAYSSSSRPDHSHHLVICGLGVVLRWTLEESTW